MDKSPPQEHSPTTSKYFSPVAFLGLGTMGYPMAGHLQRRGHPVTVYNRTRAKAEKWLDEYQGLMAATPADAVRDAKITFCCVGNDEHVRTLTTGENGAFDAMATDAVFVDHTTTSATLARELAREAENRGLAFLNSP